MSLTKLGWLSYLCASFVSANFLGQNDISQHIAVTRDDASYRLLNTYQHVDTTISPGETHYYSVQLNSSELKSQEFSFGDDIYFLSGNIALQPPASAFPDSNNNLTLCASWTDTSASKEFRCDNYEYGYYGNMFDIQPKNLSLMMLITINAPSAENASLTWNYSLLIGSTGLTYNWDSTQFVNVLDTDYDSALLVTGDLFGQPLNSSEVSFNQMSYNFLVYLFSDEQFSDVEPLRRSYTAVTSLPSVLNTTSLPIVAMKRAGRNRQQFYIENLNSSTTYFGILVFNSLASDSLGMVYSPFSLHTMNSTACKIIHDLKFCSGVAYSVPVLSNPKYNTTDALKKLYDHEVESLYANFSKALQQTNCNASMENSFSPIVTCENCVALYKSWLCSVTIPRCSTFEAPGYVLRDLHESRNEFVNDIVHPPSPYYEVMPCIDLCNSIVKNCPALLRFSCPTKPAAVEKSYYWLLETNSTLDSCNVVDDAYYRIDMKIY